MRSSVFFNSIFITLLTLLPLTIVAQIDFDDTPISRTGPGLLSSTNLWISGHGSYMKKGMLVGKFNRGKNSDILCAISQYGGANVLLSSGKKFVNPKKWSPAGDYGNGFLTGDFNGDGYTDILRHKSLLGGTLGTIEVGLSNGRSFNEITRWSTAGNRYKKFLVGDFNGDGKDDLLKYINQYGGAEVSLSNGRSFANFRKWSPAGYHGKRFWVGDFNGDGKDDLLRFASPTGGFEISLSNGSSFTDFRQVSNIADNGKEIMVADVNGDGRDDLIRGVRNGRGGEVFISTARYFLNPVRWTNEYLPKGKVVFGDFNGDRKADMAINAAEDAIYVYLSDGRQFLNEVEQPICVSVDGYLDDWKNIPLSVARGSHNLKNLKLATSSSTFYLSVTGVTASTYQIFLEPSGSRTGYRASAWSTTSFDHMIENGKLYRYTGTGLNWSWSYITEIEHKKLGQVLEIALPKRLLGSLTTSIKVGMRTLDSNWNELGRIPNGQHPASIRTNMGLCN